MAFIKVFVLVLLASMPAFSDITIIKTEFIAVGTEVPLAGTFQYQQPQIRLNGELIRLAGHVDTASWFCASLSKKLVTFKHSLIFDRNEKVVFFDSIGVMLVVRPTRYLPIEFVVCK